MCYFWRIINSTLCINQRKTKVVMILWNNRFSTNKILVLVMLIICGLCLQCDKTTDQIVPYVYVNFTIDLNDPEFVDLQVPGNSVLVNGGYKGIIIYRLSQDEFQAFDRCCTFDPYEKDCDGVKPATSTDIYAVCPCCESEYMLPSLGFPTDQSEASLPLKQYQTTYYVNSDRLQVFN